ncbi:MAG: hypothetical protein JW918_20525 [Anaerolineae bacterium]|nr:hypothetical protein [Anaerolineae bacterium]
MSRFTRREFLKIGAAAASLLGLRAAPSWVRAAPRSPSVPASVYVARNGTPAVNVQQAIALAGGIQQFIGARD